jgi:poly(A) polymerase
MEIVRKIAQEFNSHGFQLYEVGGHVRDTLLERKFDDIDLTTDALPEISKAILEKFGSVYTVGMAYGTVGLALEGLKIEVTTFRGEVYPTDSRKPNVVFGYHLAEDLARRDFTINAIAYSPIEDRYEDPYAGIADIVNKIIRCVGSEDRLEEDPLRMLRAIRFACQLDFEMRVNMNHPSRLAIISKERIREELSKILLSPDPVRGVRLLISTGLMPYIIPEFMALLDLKQGKYHMKDAYEHTLSVLDRATKYDFGQDTLILRLAALLHDIGKPKTFSMTNTEIHFYDHHMVGGDMTEKILKDLRYDSDTVDRVTSLVRRHMEPIMLTMKGEVTRRGVARLIRRVSSDKHNDIEILLVLVSCDLSSSTNPRQQLLIDLRRLVDEVQAILPKQKAPLDGNEIMALLGIKPSELVGEIKEYLCDMVIDGKVDTANKAELERLVKEYYDGRCES